MKFPFPIFPARYSESPRAVSPPAWNERITVIPNGTPEESSRARMGPESPISDFKLQISNSKFKIQNFKFEISDFKSQISNPKFLIFNFLLLLLALPSLAQTAIRHDLSGKSAESPVLWEFFGNQGENAGQWTRIPVPACLETQGFSESTFGAADPNEFPATGRYRLGFRPPESLLNKRVFIVFEGVMTDALVKLNGEVLGEHKGGFTSFRYEITNRLKFNGENLLEVVASAESSEPSVNAAERKGPFRLYSGVHRPVYLLGLPKEFIDTASINAQSTGQLSLSVHVSGLSAATSVKARVLLDNIPVGQSFSANLDKDSAAAVLTTRIQNPKPWTSETPTRYTLEISLLAGDQPIHVTTEKFGFRTVELKNEAGLFINGTRVRLKGISFDPYTVKHARAGSPALGRADAMLIKSLNANAVSLAHFPADPDFLDACDELGLYVVDTLPGAGQNVYSPEIGAKIAAEFLARNLNRPSVILFVNPNPDLDETFSTLDPQKRPILRPQSQRPQWTEFSKLANAPEPYIALDALPSPNPDALAAGLSDAWSVILKSPSAAGLFVRAVPDETASSAPSPLAPVPAIAQIFSPIQVQKTILPTSQPSNGAFQGHITLTNQFHFTNLKDCKASWITVSYSKPGEKIAAKSLAQGVLLLPDVKPGESADAIVKWLEDPAVDAVKLTLKDPDDSEIQTLVFSTRGKGHYTTPIEKTALKSFITLDEEDDSWLLTGLAGAIRVDKQTGMLKSASLAGKPLPFSNGPRVPGESKLASISKISDEDAKGLQATFSEGQLRSVQWMLLPSGWFRLTYALQAAGPQNSLGVAFTPDTIKNLSFIGDGPAPLFKNRLEGNTLGAWSLDAINGSLANVRFARIVAESGTLQLVIDDPAIHLHLSKNDLSFLHAIPPANPINAKDPSPSAQLFEADGVYQGTLYFKFGE